VARADLVRVAELVELEQLGRERGAARVPLAALGIDFDFQLGGQVSLPESRLRL